MTDLNHLSNVYAEYKQKYLADIEAGRISVSTLKYGKFLDLSINETRGVEVSSQLTKNFDVCRQHCYNIASLAHFIVLHEDATENLSEHPISVAICCDSMEMRQRWSSVVGKYEDNGWVHSGLCFQAAMVGDNALLKSRLPHLEKSVTRSAYAKYASYVPVLRGLVEGDSNLVNEGLSALAKKAKSIAPEIDHFFFQGVALAKLATERGIAVKVGHYRMPEAMFEHKPLPSYEEYDFLKKYA